MKKVMKCLGMVVLVALAFTSCKKNEEKAVIKVASQEFVCVDEDRIYINDATSHPNFEIGDMCMLYNINVENPAESEACLYEAIEEGDYVLFQPSGYGEIAEDMHDAYYAFYPGGPGHTTTELYGLENKCKFHVEPTQVYRPNRVSLGDLYMAAKETTGHLSQTDFNFKNIMGILRLKPYEAAQRTVTRIQIVDNTYHLSGWVELIIPEIDGTELQSLFNAYDPTNEAYVNRLNEWKNRTGYNVTDAGMSITLEVPEGVQLGTSKETTPEFNIVLRPLAMSQGCHIIFTFADGTTKDVDLSAYDLCAKPNVRKTQGLNLDKF